MITELRRRRKVWRLSTARDRNSCRAASICIPRPATASPCTMVVCACATTTASYLCWGDLKHAQDAQDSFHQVLGRDVGLLRQIPQLVPQVRLRPSNFRYVACERRHLHAAIQCPHLFVNAGQLRLKAGLATRDYVRDGGIVSCCVESQGTHVVCGRLVACQFQLQCPCLQLLLLNLSHQLLVSRYRCDRAVIQRAVGFQLVELSHAFRNL